MEQFTLKKQLEKDIYFNFRNHRFPCVTRGYQGYQLLVIAFKNVSSIVK